MKYWLIAALIICEKEGTKLHWNNPNNIEALFDEEIRDKKRTARGSFHNITHRGGGKKGANLKTQVDYLTGKAKREYMKGSAIVTTNFYSDIKNCPSIEELRAKEPAQAKNIIMEVKKNNTINVIKKHLKVSGYMLYKIYDQFSIEYEHRGTAEEQREAKEKKAKNFLNAPDYVPEKKEKRAYHFKDEKKPASEISREKFNELVAEAKNIEWRKEELIENETHIDNMNYLMPTPIPAPIQEVIIEKETEEFQLKYIKKLVMGSEVQKRILDFMTIVYAEKKYSIEFILKELPE